MEAIRKSRVTTQVGRLGREHGVAQSHAVEQAHGLRAARSAGRAQHTRPDGRLDPAQRLARERRGELSAA